MSQIQEITIFDLQQKSNKGENFFLIDVREDSEWQEGRLPKAVHLKLSDIEASIEKVVTDKNSQVVLYCGSGYRSAVATHALQCLGYTQVFSLAGGIKAWHSAHLPIDH